MKKMKKIMALLLAGAMTMAMSFAAFADEADTAAAPVAAGTNTLTVNVKAGTTPAQDLNGQTINLYKLFDVTESKSGETTNYAYTVNTADGYKNALVAVLGSSITATSTDEAIADAVRAVGSKDSAEVQNFANAFTAYALTHSLAATATSGKIADSKTSYKFTGLDAGYYLVYVTGGKEIQSSLVTVDSTTDTVNLKTEAPSITKTADKETVSIGQVVKYTVTGTIPDTTGYSEYQYIIHDTLTDGLDFVNDEHGAAFSGTNVNVLVKFEEGTTDAVTAPATAVLSGTNNRTMSLNLSTWVRANQTNKGKKFTVTYYAKVNAQAVVEEKNKAELEYGNKPGETTMTTPSEAKTPTYPLDILKKKKDADEKLAGAKFSLYTSFDDATNGTNAIKVSGSNGNYVVDPASENTVFESVASIDGKNFNLHVNGLAAGDYYLKEIEAPAGYNKLTAPIKITIKKSTDADETNWTLYEGDSATLVTDKYIKVENSTGSLLPSTGGRGTIAFAVVAVLLVFGVTVSYIRDKKKEA